MIYKPEHIVDLESGAIVAAAVRPGNAGDTEDLSGRVMDAVELVDEIFGREHVEGVSLVKDPTGDKGYHHPGELGIIQEGARLHTIVGDPNAERRQPANLEPEARRAVVPAARAVKSKSGKVLPKKRGEHIERGFAHVLDCGGLRGTTLRCPVNNNKRNLCGILAFNLSLIMRKLTGTGTPRQAAAARAVTCACYHALRRIWPASPHRPTLAWPEPDLYPANPHRLPIFSYAGNPVLFSTGS